MILLWAVPATASESVAQFRAAVERCEALLTHPVRHRARAPWVQCLAGLRAYVAAHAASPLAPRAAVDIGRVFEALHGVSRRATDLTSAAVAYRTVIRRYPGSPAAVDARAGYDRLRGLVGLPPLPSSEVSDPAAPQESTAGVGTIIGIRTWSAPSYTRIVIDVDRSVRYAARLVPPSADGQHPARITVDVTNARIGPGVREAVDVEDSLLQRVRTGQFDPTTARVVLDLKAVAGHTVFPLEEPYRLVVDVLAGAGDAAPREGAGEEAARAAGARLPTIVIDPGHGGKDPGAIGSGGLQEKEVVLDLAHRLVPLLEATPARVVLTRTRDVFLPLEERTAVANMRGADLFVSLHANASPDRAARGIETYILDTARDAAALRVAARENATSARRTSDLQKILRDLVRTATVAESSRLAVLVHERLVAAAAERFPRVMDLGVKQAPFYVLVGAQMPSILVEVSFVTHAEEESRLKDVAYLDRLAHGLAAGLHAYVNGRPRGGPVAGSAAR